ncbi:MAG: hypothetical protein NTV06_09320 [candidate division Zixibacteria bacterium]|nr:hypothetical protein [candidate division Zixibacteria bacterium]
MKKVSVLFLIGIGFLFFGIGPVSAATITGTAPVVYTNIEALNDALSVAIGEAFDDAIAEANDTLSIYRDQQDLARGFGNANAYSSQVATFQGFQNYSRIAVTSGVMVGVQAPSTDPDYYKNLDDRIRHDGDLFAGVGAGVSFFNVGINAKSIHPGLYLNFKFGSLSIKPTDEAKVSNTIIGAGVNYTLIKPKSGSFLFKWRGLSVGSGLIYHTSKVTYKLELDPLTEDFTASSGIYDIDGQVVIDPSVNLEVNVKTLTVPFDITTSAQALWLFNLTLGAGLDFNLGKTDILLISNGSVTIGDDLDTPPGVDIDSITPGMVHVDGSTTGVSPSFSRLRLMTGLGFNFGPAKIDIPIIYYLKSGVSAGVTVGVVL